MESQAYIRSKDEILQEWGTKTIIEEMGILLLLSSEMADFVSLSYFYQVIFKNRKNCVALFQLKQYNSLKGPDFTIVILNILDISSWNSPAKQHSQLGQNQGVLGQIGCAD